MKKTLIAMAVLAASGASFAQVTITGNLTMGYVAMGKPAGDTSGFGVDTSQINFAATEDLGSGMKATAKMALAGADRSGESGNGTVGGRDASLALATGFGVFTLGSGKSADYLSGGIAGVGAVYFDFENLGLFSARSSRDTATFALLPIAGFTAQISHQEGGNAQGLGTGAAGATAQRLNAYGLKYASGPAVVDVQLLQFDKNVGNGTGTAVDEQRLSGSYDLGVAKLGLGTQITKYAFGNTKTQSLLGVTVPVGPVTFGAQLAARKTSDLSAAADGTQNGYSLAAVYSLSKRTMVAAQYSRWDGAVNPTASSTAAGLLLSHSF